RIWTPYSSFLLNIPLIREGRAPPLLHTGRLAPRRVPLFLPLPVGTRLLRRFRTRSGRRGTGREVRSARPPPECLRNRTGGFHRPGARPVPRPDGGAA